MEATRPKSKEIQPEESVLISCAWENNGCGLSENLGEKNDTIEKWKITQNRWAECFFVIIEVMWKKNKAKKVSIEWELTNINSPFCVSFNESAVLIHIDKKRKNETWHKFWRQQGRCIE